MILVFAIVVLIFVKRLMNSKLGRAFKSIGQDEDTAESIGINVGYYKILCFIIDVYKRQTLECSTLDSFPHS